MTLYETIFNRRSVRQFEKIPFNTTELSKIENYLNNTRQLPEQSARFEIVDRENLKGGSVPYAILAYSDDSDAARINIGYTLQEVDLHLQSVGYGSLWCGMANPKEQRADYRILLGFGKTNASLRKSESDFKRKKITEISNIDNAVARAARLAPSAVNFQPWKLTFTDGKVTIGANVRGVNKLLPGRLYTFDLGIITKHIEIALEYEGNSVTAIKIIGKGKDIMVDVFYERKEKQ